MTTKIFWKHEMMVGSSPPGIVWVAWDLKSHETQLHQTMISYVCTGKCKC